MGEDIQGFVEVEHDGVWFGVIKLHPFLIRETDAQFDILSDSMESANPESAFTHALARGIDRENVIDVVEEDARCMPGEEFVDNVMDEPDLNETWYMVTYLIQALRGIGETRVVWWTEYDF